MEGGVGRGGRRWGKEGGLEWRFEGGFGQVQGSLEKWEGREVGERKGGEVRGGFKAERGRGRGREFGRSLFLSFKSVAAFPIFSNLFFLSSSSSFSFCISSSDFSPLDELLELNLGDNPQEEIIVPYQHK